MIHRPPGFAAGRLSGRPFSFVRIDPDLVRAAAESERPDLAGPSARSVEVSVADLPNDEKNAFLVRFVHADPYAGAELRRLLRDGSAKMTATPESIALEPAPEKGLRLPAIPKSPRYAAPRALASILAEMADRGVKPTSFKVMAAATDRGLGSAEAARVSRLFEREGALALRKELGGAP